jgi:ADP-heptose:LPS heptosyltransferase
MKKKLLLIFLHGFGDNIMATPAVKELSQIYDVDIVIYKKTLADKLWNHLDFKHKVYITDLPNHPRYWNPFMFWLKDYWMVKKEIRKIVDLSSYDKVIFSKIYALPHIVYVLAPFLLKRYHKIDQIAYDLGIKELKSKKTFLNIPSENREKGEAFLKENNIKEEDMIITLHLLTVAKERDFPIPKAQEFINKLNNEYKNLSFIILGSKQTFKDEIDRYGAHLQGKNVIYSFNENENEDLMTSAYLIKKSKVFIGVDSGPFHIAGALGINTIGIFRPSRIKSNQRAAFNKNIYCFDEKNINIEGILNKMRGFLK